ncbi:MAG: nucleotidyltransferase domain-containing protein [Pseudomonadota bacterium]|nr:nucleotidyltransferase domain-containing protein [Pseudomonadota bacterium]
MKYGLTAATIAKINGILANYPQVRKAIIYGSRAVDAHRTGSDIDLTLVGGKDLTLRVHHQIDAALDELLLPYTIDLSILHDIDNPKLIEHIDAVGRVFYEC